MAGELPFGGVICHDEEVVSEATNRVVRDRDVSRHAEMVAMSEVQRVLGTKAASPGSPAFPSTDSMPSLTAPRVRRSPVGGFLEEPNLPLSR